MCHFIISISYPVNRNRGLYIEGKIRLHPLALVPVSPAPGPPIFDLAAPPASAWGSCTRACVSCVTCVSCIKRLSNLLNSCCSCVQRQLVHVSYSLSSCLASLCPHLGSRKSARRLRRTMGLRLPMAVWPSEAAPRLGEAYRKALRQTADGIRPERSDLISRRHPSASRDECSTRSDALPSTVPRPEPCCLAEGASSLPQRSQNLQRIPVPSPGHC